MTQPALRFWTGANAADLVEMADIGGDRFVNCVSEESPGRTVYGGQVMAQSLAAAMQVEDGRVPLAMQASFLNGIDYKRPVEYRIEPLQLGRNFSVRRLAAMQGEQLCFVASCSFKSERPGGVEHHLPFPDGTPMPEDCPTLAEFAQIRPEPSVAEAARRMTTFTAIELKPCDPLGFVEPRSDPRRRYWARIPSAAGITDPAILRQLVAYLSDYWIAGGGVMASHQAEFPDSYPRLLSLSHAIWFHGIAPLDDWILFDADSPFASGGTGLCRATLFDRTGKPLASIAQTVLVRT